MKCGKKWGGKILTGDVLSAPFELDKTMRRKGLFSLIPQPPDSLIGPRILCDQKQRAEIDNDTFLPETLLDK